MKRRCNVALITNVGDAFGAAVADLTLLLALFAAAAAVAGVAIVVAVVVAVVVVVVAVTVALTKKKAILTSPKMGIKANSIRRLLRTQQQLQLQQQQQQQQTTAASTHVCLCTLRLLPYLDCTSNALAKSSNNNKQHKY